MTEHDQRVAIAQWMGPETRTPSAGGRFMRVDNPLPDFCHDLNAMHEAEMRLDDRAYGGSLMRFDKYTCELRDRFGRSIRATAAQRAEALLRTLNLWRDDPPAPTP